MKPNTARKYVSAVFEGFRGRAGTVKTTARDSKNHPLAAHETFRATIRAISEGLTRQPRSDQPKL